MKIAKFTYCNPDSDGDVRLDGAAVIENASDFDAELVKISCTVLNSSGVTAGGSVNDEENVFINPKSSEEIDLNLGWGFHKDIFEGSLDKISVLVEATTYKREFVKIGSLEMPEVGALNMIKKNISLGGLAEIRGVSALRKKNDDEGQIELEIRAGFRNISDTHIERAQLSTKLIDQRDAEIESTVDYNPVPSKSAYLFEPRFWGIKAAKVKNAELIFSGSIFVPMDTFTAEAIATLEDE
jgi:hypothetical protein|tara:strand:+ start:74 stop:793 length:720 start_codon:yes stop_codon:yes gene_type:complete